MSQPARGDVLEHFVAGLESTLFLPSRLQAQPQAASDAATELLDASSRYSSTAGKKLLIFDTISDASVLTCGCIVSERLAALEALHSTQGRQNFGCPVCHEYNVAVLAPLLPLRKLYHQIQEFRKNIPESEPDASSTSIVERNDSVNSSKSRRKSTKLPQQQQQQQTTLVPSKKSNYSESYSRLSSRSGRSRNKMSLLSLFHATALKIKEEEYQTVDDDLSTQFSIYESRLKESSKQQLQQQQQQLSSFGNRGSFSLEGPEPDAHSQNTSSSLTNTQALAASYGSGIDYLARTESQTSHKSANTGTDSTSIISTPKIKLKSHKSMTNLMAPSVAASSTSNSQAHHLPAPISIPKANRSFASSSDAFAFSGSEYFAVGNAGTSNINTPSSLYFGNNTPSSAKDHSGESLKCQNYTPKEEFSKEYRFASNFPVYRKRVQYSTQSSKMMSLIKRSDFIGTSISPDATKFALIDDKKWMVYTIDPDSSNPPTLLCCGKNNCHYGINFENLKKLNSKFYTEEKLKIVLGDEETQKMIHSGHWTFEHCALSNNFFVIAGKRIIKVFDIQRDGKPVYTHNIEFPIRCLDISSNEQFIACGLTGKDKLTDSEGSLIMLFELFFEEDNGFSGSIYEQSKAASFAGSSRGTPPFSNSSIVSSELHSLNAAGGSLDSAAPLSFCRANSSLITLHYKDPINNVKFSHDAKFLGVLTALESRFMVINISKPSAPRLVMKASRKLDTSYESEGITDLCFFGDNNKYLAVSSVAFNAPSLILETRISNLKESQSVAHPRMLMKVEEIGSMIHKCCVSPRNDAFAFLNKKGSVYIMHVNKNFERKRIVLTGDVMSATKKSEAASLRFSKDGHKLFAVDRKGVLYIDDFIAGTPKSHDVTKCKSIT